MPPAAGLAIGGIASGIGSIASAYSSKPQQVPTTPPNPLSSSTNTSYINSLNSAGPGAISALSKTAETGNAVPVGDLFSTMLASQQRLLEQGRAGLREQYGAQGLAGSSNLGTASTDFETQSNLNFSNTLAQLALSSNEAAQNRALTAQQSLAGQFGNLGSAYTPSSTLVTGTASAAGAGLSSVGSSLSMLALLRSMGMLGPQTNSQTNSQMGGG